jgi:hypothetical protein
MVSRTSDQFVLSSECSRGVGVGGELLIIGAQNDRALASMQLQSVDI